MGNSDKFDVYGFFYNTETFGLLWIALIEAVERALLTRSLSLRICHLNRIFPISWSIVARSTNFAICWFTNLSSSGNKTIKITAVYLPTLFANTSISLICLVFPSTIFLIIDTMCFLLYKIYMWFNVLNEPLFRFFSKYNFSSFRFSTSVSLRRVNFSNLKLYAALLSWFRGVISWFRQYFCIDSIGFGWVSRASNKNLHIIRIYIRHFVHMLFYY